MTSDPRYQKIHAAVCAVPAGRVSSYGRIAADAALPGRARLVGKVLSELTADDSVPWHRIVRASGQLAFPPGSEQHQRPVDLLEDEGVVVQNGRVSMRRYTTQIDLDELIWRN